MDNIHADKTSGEAAIAYAGDTPWHRHGQKIAAADVYDVDAALAAAHADFTVETVPMFHNIDAESPEGCYSAIDNRVVIRRTDTLVPLGVGSNRYRCIQTVDGMEFLKGILGEGKVAIEVVGVLGEGERVWVLAKVAEGQIPIIGDDVIEKYLLFALDHSGQLTFVGIFTPIRVVCHNTLTSALGAAKASECVKIRHSGDVQAKLAVAASLLKNAGIFFNEVSESYRWLATKQVNTEILLDYMMRVCEQSLPYQDTSQKVKNRIELYQKAHEMGAGSDLKGVRGTLWGAYNAVTEVVDHKLAVDNREPVKYMGFGTGRDIKRRALSIALDVAGKLN